MKAIAQLALDTASQRGATYADARIVDERQRALSTKNGKTGHVSDAESLGIGVRVIADGAWGFAASDSPKKEDVEGAAAQAVAIAPAYSSAPVHAATLLPAARPRSAQSPPPMAASSRTKDTSRLSNRSRWRTRGGSAQTRWPRWMPSDARKASALSCSILPS